MSEPRWTLPPSWEWAGASTIARIIGGGTPSTKEPGNFTSNGIPWVTPADLSGYTETYITRGARDLSQKGYDSSAAQLLPAGTVLFSSRAPVGYCVIAKNEIATNQGFKSLVLEGDISPEYVRYYLLGSKEYAEGLARGTTFKELSGGRMGNLSIPVAPLSEQRRIVEKVDKLMTRTARAKRECDRVPALIAKYKQAILSAAFSGELTREWRSRILGHDEKKWDQQTLADLCDIQTGITLGKKRPPGVTLVSAPYLRVANVQRGYLSLDEVKTVQVTPDEVAKLRLQKGDILMNEGGDRDKLGRGWVWGDQIPDCIHQNHVFRLRLRDSQFPSEYISHFANENGQAYFLYAGKQTTNLASISKKRVGELVVPLPPAEEADEIVRRIKTSFSWLDRIAGEHSRSSILLPLLEQGILAKAFRGELMPQDANDEPASVLLERIKAARSKQFESQPKRGQKPRGPKRLHMATPKEQLEKDLASWPAQGVSFEELSQRISGDYESIRAAVFELLAGPRPVMKQHFDKKAKLMRLKRAAA
jgi:type I restriction enzyme, S subunit